MANREDNLIPEAHKLTEEDRVKGAYRSAEVRREKKTFKEVIDNLLAREYSDGEGNTLQGTEAICVRILQRALKGEKWAAEFIRDTAGEKPVEKVMMTDIPKDVIDEVERIVNGCEYSEDIEEKGD